MSSNGHRNIKFKYEHVLRYVLFSLNLLGKFKTKDMELCFTLDAAEVCKPTKRGHVLVDIDIINRETKFPGKNKFSVQQ